MRSRVALALVGVVVLAGCGGAAGTDSTLPPDPGAPVLSVTGEGGFVPVEFNLDRMPRYVLMGDHTLIFQGPIPEIFPGPLLPNTRVTAVSQADWDEIMRLVEELGIAGLTEEVFDTEGADMIADAPTTFINYHVDGEVRRMGFYALDIAEVAGNTDRTLARELLEIFDEATMGDSDEYAPDRLQVAAGPGGEPEPGMTTVEPWPSGLDYAAMTEWALGWRCVEVEGDTVDELLPVLGAANQMTVWDTGSEQLSIKAHPVLPGEVACAGGPSG